MDAWLGLIGALAGTAIGGFVTYRVARQQNDHERQTERDRRRVAAYESMHLILSKLSGQASQINLGVIGAVGMNIPFKADVIKGEVEIDRLRMLVDFYAPELSSAISAISDQFGQVGRAAAEAILKKEPSDSWRGETAEKSVVAALELARLARAAQVRVAELARSIDAR
jgi:hypothetical protein